MFPLKSLRVIYSPLLQKSKEKRERKTESFYRGGLLGRGLTSSTDELTQLNDDDEDIGICECGVNGKNFSLSRWEASNTISVASRHHIESHASVGARSGVVVMEDRYIRNLGVSTTVNIYHPANTLWP